MEQNKQTKRVGIQGEYGAFHDIAARAYFGTEEIEIIPCDTFIDLFASIEKGESDFTVMAIENTLSGSLIQNYGLLRDSSLVILGEIYQRIEQNLMALPGTKIKDIKEVYSHPMAIAQCRPFFKQYPHVKLIESLDTALSAKHVRDNNQTNTGALASRLAAEMYELEIIAPGIETNKKNYTRFLILGHKERISIKEEEIDKSSIVFSLPHEVGSLSKVLSVLAFYGLDLTKIQSLPIIGREWQYQMFVDLAFSDYKRYCQAIEAIKPLTEDFVILGEYAIGKKSFEKIHHVELNGK